LQRLYSEKLDEKVVMNGQYVASWKKKFAAYFNTRHLRTETEENNEIHR
jgi:hypothetical protein